MTGMDALLSTTIDTVDGPFTIVEAPDGLVLATGWTAAPDEVLARLPRSLQTGGVVPTSTVRRSTAATAVIDYYEGDLDAPSRTTIGNDLGTPFQRAVWAVLRQIPAGQTRQYGDIAAAIGAPLAVRAVGAACGRNPLALFVPCHRVIGSDGRLTGFAWGIAVKESLLRREGTLPTLSPSAAHAEGSAATREPTPHQGSRPELRPAAPRQHRSPHLH